MEDEDLMMFGKYRGKPICEVPGDYLLFIDGKAGMVTHPEVREWISNHREQLEREAVLRRSAR